MTTLLPELGWECSRAMIEDPPNYFKWRKGDKSLKLLDTTNYWKVSLAKIGERIGLEKLDFPVDWDDVELGDTYCKRDVEILLLALQLWIAWLKEHQLGGLGISLAQQAWKAYVHRFLEAPIFIDDDTKSHELARDGYYGGRVECFKIRQEIKDVYGCDVNSMYPFVMREHEYPTRLHGVYRKVKDEELERWLDRYAVMARVRIKTDVPVYPTRTKHGLMFPIGEFVTTLATPELRYAHEHGHIQEVTIAAIYDKAKIFTRFVDTMYAIRLELAAAGDMAGKWYVRIMMNSLYGKWGQHGIEEKIIGKCDPNRLYVETEIDLDTGKRYRIRHIAGLILSRTSAGESRYSHPAIAAHVTSYARMLLWQLLQAAGVENTYYMDTDSLHVNRVGYDRLGPYLSETKLGGLKLEKRVQSAIYYGPKDYVLDGKRCLKGVSIKAVEMEPGVFEQAQWVSLKGSCLVDHSGGPLVRRVVKRHKREYRKGKVDSAGVITPWRRVINALLGSVDTD